jgi:hypothetical protein
MGGRSRRLKTLDTPTDRVLIDLLGKARNASVQGMGKVEIGGDVYRALDKLNHAIDDVCAATGRPREHFWAKANSA